CHLFSFMQRHEIPVRVSSGRNCIVQVCVEGFISDPPIVFSQADKPFRESPSRAIQQRMVNLCAEVRSEGRIVKDMCLRCCLPLQIEGKRITCTKRQFLLPACLENRGRNGYGRYPCHLHTVQGTDDPVPAHIDRHRGVESSPRTHAHLSGGPGDRCASC